MRNKSRVPDLPSSSLKETSFLEGQLNQARQGAFQTGLERKERNLKRNQKMGETFAYKEYLAGLLAGVATVITGHPFDTVKVKGLYRGATSSFVGVAFESSLLFGIYSQTKQSLQGGGQSDVPRPEVIIPSAAYGGAIISFVLCPTELVKCRLQIQGTDSLVPKFSRYSSPLDCALQTVKNEGVTGIFRGGSTTLLRESIGNAVFFSVYEYVRYYMHLRLKPTLLTTAI
uniref:Mitochondrial carrier protein n=1 Tax=Salix viminalis TaxID=40686 RepID=A0A6N2KGR7_SALVM